MPDSARGTSGKILLFTFFIFICIFIVTHLFPVPYGLEIVHNALGGLEIFDKQPSFSSNEVYNRLQSFLLEGLEVYKRFTYTIDIIFPLTFFSFLITLARFVTQRTSLSKYLVNAIIVLPFIWLSFDLLENLIVFILLSEFPIRNNFLGSLLGFVTATKFGLLFLSILIPLIPVNSIILQKGKKTSQFLEKFCGS
ncbi:hypothetical protein [Flavobacterium sp. ZS1P14]|uniref:hypothetical protein n=1 Tax=Flavobacterium sp. ZS1P14 TaxID=3401729 RepID=UPI003AAFA64E